MNTFGLNGKWWDWGVAADVLGVVSTVARCVPGLQVVGVGLKAVSFVTEVASVSAKATKAVKGATSALRGGVRSAVDKAGRYA